MNPTVLFNEPDEFTAELLKDKARVQRDIVRVTQQFRSGITAPIRLVFVVATAMIEGQLVRLKSYCGEDWGPRFTESQKTKDRAKTIVDQLQAFCQEQGFDFRGGLLEEARS